MKKINEITKENFQSMFNIQDILDESVFYPAAGIDASDIESLSNEFCSFIHVDYSTPKEVVEPGLRMHFECVGYDLIGIKDVSKEELTPAGFTPNNFALNDYEKQRLVSISIRDRFNQRNFKPFALWALYELNPAKTGKTHGKAQRFSILHIGGEACATFEALYIQNKINPSAIAIINPGEGYGDNWTRFSDPQFRLHQNVIFNAQNNNATMPNIILTNMVRSDEDNFFWPNYTFNRRSESTWLRIYKNN